MSTELNNTEETTETSLTEAATTEAIDTRRRNITKVALWTPPVMMTLMLSKRASASSTVTEVLPDAPSKWGGY